MLNRRSSIAIALLTAACTSFADHHACTEVSIDSAGSYCLDSSRVLGVAPGAGGLGGIANYVRISPPSNASDAGTFSDLASVILMADVNPAAEPRCIQSDDKSEDLQCSLSVPGKKLHIVVSFDSGYPHERVAERTMAIAADVAHNVVKRGP